ncbi:hypothetical protein NPJ88_006610 [Halomonas elongata]|uniref:hypothetical protein n=1 Tax=Halomonas elongata TaxID=2746 RepID=UPI00255A9F74|nr:hypothetical protein [Halomonas elongata]MDL4861998.1 hypothetical protein [Halomonas elongata]
MNRQLESRLERLERADQDQTVRDISDLMDELSDKAGGGDGRRQSSESMGILEDKDHAQ